MKQVRLTLEAGGHEADIHPVYDLLSNGGCVDRAAAIQWNFTSEQFAIIHHVEGDVEAFVDAFEDLPPVRAFEVEPAGDDVFYVYVRDRMTDEMRSLLRGIENSPAVVLPPVEYESGGTVSFPMFGPESEIRTALDDLPQFVEVGVREIRDPAAIPGSHEPVLTDRQREAVEAGLSLGYYEVPREAGHEDVAEAIGCEPGAAAEHLRKAESKLLRSVV